MKRIILLYSFFAFCLLMVKANPVSRTQALQEAKAFLATKGIDMQTVSEAYKALRKAGAKENNPYYYIYNVGEDRGFVIVSGDDRTEKILGYVDSGSFDEENAPAPLKEWLRAYEREIESISSVQLPSTTAKKKVIEKTKKSIAPMTSTKWASRYPFKTSTPIVDGKNLPIGCAPVCLAQFLYYYKDFIPSITNTIPSYVSNGVTLDAVPSGTMIDWDNMLEDYGYNSNYTDAQKKAVADLMLYTAKATSTRFYTDVALTPTSQYNSALINYFGFDESIAYIDREYYNVEDWENVIYNEIAHLRPVIYNGFSSSAGHSYLIDGYDVNGLFHVNWGWGGIDDGYFRLSVFNRYQANIVSANYSLKSYTDKHSALLYTVPSSFGCVNTSDHQLNAKIVSASSSTISCKFHNQSGISGYYLYGIGYVNEDDQVVLIKQFNKNFAYLNNTNSASRYFTLSANDFNNASLEYGTYELVPIYMYKNEEDNEEWKVCQHESANYAIVNYSESGISSRLHSNLSNVSVSKFDIIGDGLKGSEQAIKTTITNVSPEYSYSGIIYCFVSNTTTMGEAIDHTRINMDKDESVLIDFSYKPSSSGTYYVWIATDEFGDNIIGQTQMEISSGTVPELDISERNFSIVKNFAGLQNGLRSIWGSTFQVNITHLKNNTDYTIRKNLAIWIREYATVTSSSWDYNRSANYSDNGRFYLKEIIVPPHTDYTLPVVFENLKLNTRYDIRVEYQGGNKIIDVLPMVMLPALTTWKADGSSISVEPQETMTIDDDVIAVDITDATAIKTLNVNSNPNVLYYMGASQTIPNGLENANIVKGDKAENVALRDSCDFFVPKTFTAERVSFTTIPSIGAESGSNVGWNTIALPFDVMGVVDVTDNKEIDWFHPGETTGKDFWVRGFERLDKDGDIIFADNVDEMLAYEPYLYNVPGEYWGKRRNLCGKQITFFGENATLYKDVNVGVHSSAYNLMGTTVGKNVSNAWFINSVGNAFLYAQTQDVPAFHAYFMDNNQVFGSSVAQTDKPILRIKFQDGNNQATGISTTESVNTNKVDVYNLQGVKVATLPSANGIVNLNQLPKGIYMVNGKKVMK